MDLLTGYIAGISLCLSFGKGMQTNLDNVRKCFLAGLCVYVRVQVYTGVYSQHSSCLQVKTVLP